jgi:hypothetical protein
MASLTALSWNCANYFAAVSTKLVLGGKTPGMYAPALQQNRLKRDLLVNAKLNECGAGLGIAGWSCSDASPHDADLSQVSWNSIWQISRSL